ncbi:acyl-CoA dehydrogenase family protein [Pseudomonas sp. QE6]|uniref:acyl-CoA dehydrogenase family protein n=1 Tax=Pseudomonas sp. QE6 TaxID=3242491 RepID=UPI00352773EB
MNLQFGIEEQRFREEVRAWIGEAFDDQLRALMRRSKNGFLDKQGQQCWQKKLHARGWAAPDWPTEHGGPGWTPTQRYLFQCEIAAAGCPPISPMGIKMVAPVIMGFGSEAQKARFLPPTLSSDIFWCQGYSEPGAGSDLSALKMRAERDGDDYVLNGSKIWTTHAQWADWMFCLVRTSREAKQQAGISFLLVDMKSPGIRVSPLPLLDGPYPGEQEVNEVFFDNVRVPLANRIGEEGQGWTCAKYLLEFERGNSYGPALRYQLGQVMQLAERLPGVDGRPMAEDPDFQRRYCELAIRVEAVEATELRLFSGQRSGSSVGAASSMIKLVGTETKQAISELAIEVAGPRGWPFVRDTWAENRGRDVEANPGSPELAALLPRYFNYRKTSVYGGTSEIQRNIIAKQILGL